MASDHKTPVEENAARIVDWLLEHRSEFEQDGVEESNLARAVGLSDDDATRALDHLESHEDVARFPEALSNPPRFLLKPARGWHEIVEGQANTKRAGGNP